MSNNVGIYNANSRNREALRDLQTIQAQTIEPGTRQWMIEQIKALAPDFQDWYNEVYKLRADGKQAEYETAIKAKFIEACELDPADHIQTIARDAGCTAEIIDTRPKQSFEDFKTIAAKYAPKPFTPKPKCDHSREYATLKGMQCRDCFQIRDAANEFEARLVSKLTPRMSGYVNYNMR